MEAHVSLPSPSWPYSETASNKMEVEREFILTWKTCPALWDPRDQYYTNKYKRLEYLKHLLTIYKKIKPNATTDDVRRKINIFRSNYKRELNKIQLSRHSAHGADGIYSPRVWYFPLLHFLIESKRSLKWDQDSSDYKEAYSSISREFSPNKVDRAPHTEHSGSEQSSEDEKTIIKEEIYYSVNQQREEPKPDIHGSVLRNIKPYDENEVLNFSNSLPSEPRSTMGSQINPQALIWAEKLDRLCPLQKLYAEKAINDILFEAELGNLDRFSVQINAVSGSKSFI